MPLHIPTRLSSAPWKAGLTLAACVMALAVASARPTAILHHPAKPAPVTFSAALRDTAFLAAFGTRFPSRISIRKNVLAAGGVYLFRPDRLVQVGSKVALISVGDEERCTSCRTALAIDYLEWQDQRLHKSNISRILTTTGFLTRFRGWALRMDLTDHAVVVFEEAWPTSKVEESFDNDGCSAAYAKLIELQPDGPQIIAELIPTFYGYCDPAGGTKLSKKVKLMRNEAGLRASYSGYEPGVVEYRRRQDGRFLALSEMTPICSE